APAAPRGLPRPGRAQPPVMSPATPTLGWRRPALIASPWRRCLLVAGVLAYLWLALGSVELNWPRIAEGVQRGLRFLSAFLQPDFSSRWTEIAEGLLESLAMTIVATVLGIALSLPFGLGAARKLAPPPVYLACRAVVG